MADDRRSASGEMEGGGYYTDHSEAQAAYGELGFEWLEQAAAEVEPPAPPLPFVIADMGAAGGGNSLQPMRRALAARRADGPALVVHTDIPENDFSALFELIGNSPDTYVGEPGVFAFGEGRSFYEPLFPEGTLSLGWSSIAVHWLSEVPEPIPDHIFSTFATGRAREALRERSARDWRDFLACRARELRPSARMVIVGGAAREDGLSGAEGLMELAVSALRELVDDGDLDEAELTRMTIPTWNRTAAEFREPFESGELDGTLELLRDAARSLPDVYFEAYRTDHDLGRYCDGVTGFFRAAFGDSLWAGLDARRDASQRDSIAARFDRLLRRRIEADPDAAASRWHVVVLDIARVTTAAAAAGRTRPAAGPATRPPPSASPTPGIRRRRRRRGS